MWNRGRLAVLDALVRRDLVAHDPSVGVFGFEQLAQFVARFRSAFPDFAVAGEDWVAQGNRVALRFRSTGTFLGEFMGLRPSGRRIEWGGLVMYRLSGGKIAELWVEWDHRRFLADLGSPFRQPT